MDILNGKMRFSNTEKLYRITKVNKIGRLKYFYALKHTLHFF
jgi:hypothetical protein